jgi:hypothetical protein
MHRFWLIFDPRQAFIGMHLFLGALAFMIHFTLLSTEEYNWLDHTPPPSTQPSAALPAPPG